MRCRNPLYRQTSVWCSVDLQVAAANPRVAARAEKIARSLGKGDSPEEAFPPPPPQLPPLSPMDELEDEDESVFEVELVPTAHEIDNSRINSTLWLSCVHRSPSKLYVCKCLSNGHWPSWLKCLAKIAFIQKQVHILLLLSGLGFRVPKPSIICPLLVHGGNLCLGAQVLRWPVPDLCSARDLTWSMAWACGDFLVQRVRVCFGFTETVFRARSFYWTIPTLIHNY